jgi:hypothetical protein
MVLNIRRKALKTLLYYHNQYQNTSVVLISSTYLINVLLLDYEFEKICAQISIPLQSPTTPGNAMKATRQLGPQLQLIKRVLSRRCQYRSFCLFTCQSVLRQSALLPLPPNRISQRHAGTKLRKSIEELPQGLQTPLEPFIEKEASKYSPVIDEVLQNQRRFPKCVLLTRVGQFYEVLTSMASLILVVLFSSG